MNHSVQLFVKVIKQLGLISYGLDPGHRAWLSKYNASMLWIEKVIFLA